MKAMAILLLVAAVGTMSSPAAAQSPGAERIAYKHVGPVTREILDGTLLPIVNRLRNPKDRGKP